jgi:hypothetical protein
MSFDPESSTDGSDSDPASDPESDSACERIARWRDMYPPEIPVSLTEKGPLTVWETCVLVELQARWKETPRGPFLPSMIFARKLPDLACEWKTANPSWRDPRDPSFLSFVFDRLQPMKRH